MGGEAGGVGGRVTRASGGGEGERLAVFLGLDGGLGQGADVSGMVVRKESYTAFALTSPPPIGLLLVDVDAIPSFERELV